MATGTRADTGTAVGPSDDAEFPDIADLSYEAAREELVSVVARLEGGDAGLEESMTLWRRGEALAAHCSRWLEQAETAIAEATDADR